jgi:hypothetical protein
MTNRAISELIQFIKAIKTGVRAIHHINDVDAVTEFQVIVTVERISEAFMLPAIQQIL